MMTVTVDEEYQNLDSRDVLAEASPAIATAVRELLPTFADLTAEFRQAIRRVVPHVEFMETAIGRNLVLETEPGFEQIFHRRRIYAQCSVSGEVATVLSRGVTSPRLIDEVRNGCLHAARRMGERVASQIVSEYRVGGGINPVTVRLIPGLATPKYQTHYDEAEPRVFMSMNTDEVLVRLFAYYVIAPPGSEAVAS